MSVESACDLMEGEVRSGRFPAEVVKGLFSAAGQQNRRGSELFPAGLTRREVDVLGCLVRGMSNKEIAEALTVSPKTVENHLTRIYDKIGCSGRAYAALYALENAIFEYQRTP